MKGAIHMLKEGIGLLMTVLGISFGNSENLILPFALILIGAWLILSSKGEE